MYEKGLGVPKDTTLAFKCYEESAKQGYPLGEFNLGVAYENGIGCAPDLKLALKWYTKGTNCSLCFFVFLPVIHM
jgi:TPR repeat protein